MDDSVKLREALEAARKALQELIEEERCTRYIKPLRAIRFVREHARALLAQGRDEGVERLTKALDTIETGFRKPFDHLDGCLFKADRRMPCQCDPRARMEKFRRDALAFLDEQRAALKHEASDEGKARDHGHDAAKTEVTALQEAICGLMELTENSTDDEVMAARRAAVEALAWKAE